MATKIQLRGDTAANWTSVNPILSEREMGIEKDTRKFKFGDGATAWNSLDYASSEGDSHFLGIYVSLLALQTAHPTADPGDYADVDPGSGTDAIRYLWDEEDGWVTGGSGAGVQSVSGDFVDNTDPTNPVITGLTAALGAKSNAIATVSAKTGDYTIQQSDNEAYIPMGNASGSNVTIEPRTEGTSVVVYRSAGAGVVTFVASGTTITTTSGSLTDPGVNNSTDVGAYMLVFWRTSTAVEINNGTSQILPANKVLIPVKNSSGSSIAANKPVYVTGVDVTTGYFTIALARSNDDTTSRAIGWTAGVIANGASGYVIEIGMLTGVNTNGLTTGQLVYLSSAVAGDFTVTAPTYPNPVVRIGVVGVVNASTGTILATAPTYASTRYTPRTAVMTANQTNTNAVANTLETMTQLTMPVLSGRRYKISYFIGFNTDASTTGGRFVFETSTGTQGSLRFNYRIASGGTSESLIFSGLVNIPSVTTTASTTASNSATCIGFYVPNADQDLFIRFACEVANPASLTALAGSWFTVEEIL